MNTEGHLLLHRCFRLSWQWQRPLWRSAWIWLLANAAPEDRPEEGLRKGQLHFSMLSAGKEWGMSESAARRFLWKAEEHGDIVWDRGVGSRKPCPKSEPPDGVCGGGSGGPNSLITIVNHVWFEAPTNTPDGVCGGGSGGQLAPKPKVKTKQLKTVAKTVDEVQSGLDAVDLARFRVDFADDGLNIDQLWENFSETCLEGTATKPGINPYKYKDFTMAFRQWCRKRRDEPQPPAGGTPIGKKTSCPDWLKDF